MTHTLVRRTWSIVLAFVWLFSTITPAWSAITASLEGPEEAQQVAGIGIIRGWAFSDGAGVTITQVKLSVDGTPFTNIPCCSPRSDVAQAYPQIPSPNALNSGFGFTVNYGNLSSGSHSIGVEIRDSSGATQNITHAVTVVRAGSSQFLDQLDLNSVTAKREGQDVILTGIRVRDKVSQQVLQITTRLRWFRNIQGLGLVESSTTGTATLQVRQSRAQTAATGAEISPIKALIESPSNGQTVAGIAVLRGWVFSGAGRTIRKVELSVDGNFLAAVPCCSLRSDVAAGFPNTPEALNSGFGITVNYGGLTTGVHTIAIKVEDSAGATRTFYKGVLAKRQGGIAFVNQLDLSSSTVRIANGALVIEGVKVSSPDTPQPVTRIQRYRFDVSAQAFLLAEDSGAEIAITNTSCVINGNTSNLSSLQKTPGVDGVSLPEVLAVLNNTPATVDVLVTWQVKGVYACSSPNQLANLTRGNITLDGDVDGDGVADVTLDGTGVSGFSPVLYISSSNATARYLRVVGNGTGNPVVVTAQPGAVVVHVALIGIIITSPQRPPAALVFVANPTGNQSASIRDSLVSSCQLTGGGIHTLTIGDNGSGVGELQRITIAENTVETAPATSITVNHSKTQKSLISKIVVANNIINSSGKGVIFQGGAGEGAASDNIVEGTINGNFIHNAKNGGIEVVAGQTFQGTATRNSVIANIQDNQVDGGSTEGTAITVAGGASSIEDTSSPITKNTTIASISGNEVQESRGGGISITGSFGNQSLSIQNHSTADVYDNLIKKSKYTAILAAGGWSASESTAEVMISNNTVVNTEQNGIEINGGTARDRGNNQQGAASNTALGTIQGNTVQGSAFTDIAVFGGFAAEKGAVIGNVAEQRVFLNNARTPLCQDGIAGNTARCTFTNASTEAETGSQRKERAITVQPAAIPLLNHLDERIADLKARAQEATSPESAAELTRLAERLEERKAEIMLRQRQ
jgi:hypothetical protein